MIATITIKKALPGGNVEVQMEGPPDSTLAVGMLEEAKPIFLEVLRQFKANKSPIQLPPVMNGNALRVQHEG